MGNPVNRDGAKAGVGQDNLIKIACSRVSVKSGQKIGLHVLSDGGDFLKEGFADSVAFLLSLLLSLWSIFLSVI